jgi:DNA-binding transcriptional MerR regulator
MAASGDNLWTIAELQAQVALALSAGAAAELDGRVRAVPDLRTIRYYTTLGLLDRAAAVCGRTALYGRRHLLQLVAIKRLQARGLTLAQVQEEVLGRSDAALARMAQLPADFDPGPAGSGAQAPTSAAFWKAVPVEAAAVHPTEKETAAAQVQALQGVPLTEEIILMLAPARRLESDDIEALRAAAAPLLKLLEKRRLWLPRRERRDS